MRKLQKQYGNRADPRQYVNSNFEILFQCFAFESYLATSKNT